MFTSAPTYNTNKSSCISPSSQPSSTDLDQTGNDLNLPVEHSDVESRPLVVVEAVHLGALVHQGQDGVGVEHNGSVVESRVTSPESR